MILDYLKLLIRKCIKKSYKINAFVLFKMSSLNQPCKGLLHRSTTLQQNNGPREKKSTVFHILSLLMFQFYYSGSC